MTKILDIFDLLFNPNDLEFVIEVNEDGSLTQKVITTPTEDVECEILSSTLNESE